MTLADGIDGATAIFRRDFGKFIKNPIMIATTLILPIMYLVVFGSAMGGTLSHIPVGVVQEVPPYIDTPLFTSAAYQLNHITQTDAEKQMDVTGYTDEDIAKQDLEQGKLAGVIVFPSSVSRDHAIELYVDSSDSITPSIVEAALNRGLREMGADNPVTVVKIYGDIHVRQLWR